MNTCIYMHISLANMAIFLFALLFANMNDCKYEYISVTAIGKYEYLQYAYVIGKYGYFHLSIVFCKYARDRLCMIEERVCICASFSVMHANPFL